MKRVKGMKDFLPKDHKIYTFIVNIAKEISYKYGFQSCDVPILEYSDIFAKTLGETSDVVRKEMYSLLDKNEESLTLRPEFTAGVVRSALMGNITLPARLFSYGQLF